MARLLLTRWCIESLAVVRVPTEATLEIERPFRSDVNVNDLVGIIGDPHVIQSEPFDRIIFEYL